MCKYKLLFGLLLVLLVVLYLRKMNISVIERLRKMYKEEYDNFDISINYPVLYSSQYAPAGVVDYLPVKTSKLIAYQDQNRGEAIEY